LIAFEEMINKICTRMVQVVVPPGLELIFSHKTGKGKERPKLAQQKLGNYSTNAGESRGTRGGKEGAGGARGGDGSEAQQH
jgi:hypothetical protein